MEAGSLSSHSDLITNASKQPVRQAHWWAQNRAYRIWELAQLSGMDGEESRGHLLSLRTFSTFFHFFPAALDQIVRPARVLGPKLPVVRLSRNLAHNPCRINKAVTPSFWH